MFFVGSMCLSDQQPRARRISTDSGRDRYGQCGGHVQAERPLASARGMQAREEPSWCVRAGQSAAGRGETKHRGQPFRPCKLTPVPFSFFSRSPCLLHSVLKTVLQPVLPQLPVKTASGPRMRGLGQPGPEPSCGPCAPPPETSVHSLLFLPGMRTWKSLMDSRGRACQHRHAASRKIFP